MSLIIKNKGQDIVETNFYSLPHNKAGKFLVSANAGAFRLLIPDGFADAVIEPMPTNATIEQDGEIATIILENPNTDPYGIETTMNAFDRRPVASDSGKTRVLSGWVNDGTGKAIKAFDCPCTYIRK